MEALVVALLLVAALVPLALPLFRPPMLALRSASGPAARLQALEMRKAALYGAIREAGFDLRTDKVESDDYEQQVELLKREAIEVVGEIEELKTNPPRASKRVERAIAAVRKGVGKGEDIASSAQSAAPASEPTSAPPSPPPSRATLKPTAEASETAEAARFCTQCGAATAGDARFCAQCGAGLERGE